MISASIITNRAGCHCGGSKAGTLFYAGFIFRDAKLKYRRIFAYIYRLYADLLTGYAESDYSKLFITCILIAIIKNKLKACNQY
jgi:hypothetical protein